MNEQKNPLQCTSAVPTRIMRLTRLSCIGNGIVGIGKLSVGLLSSSFFTCISAFYTFGMLAAKLSLLPTLANPYDARIQNRRCRGAGWFLIMASLLYIAYSIHQYFSPSTMRYPMYAALGIAAFTFTELTLNIRGVILARANQIPAVFAMKCINLAASLICLVLTQSAILSFSAEGLRIPPETNGRFGIFMGCGAALLGILIVSHFRNTDSAKAPNIRKEKTCE